MWSNLVLCCLVGLAFASSNPAWKDNTEYSYEVRGRTLASLFEVSPQHTGILLKAKLTIQTKTSGNLVARITEPKYGQIHTALSNGWNTHIPDSQVHYKDLALSSQPFEIVLQNGVIVDLIVSKELSNWEANIIKSIVSQFQLDTKGQRLISSPMNSVPQENMNNGVVKVMEETVSGQSETLYDIHPLPEYILESKPWLVPQKQYIGTGEVLEIVKNKNFTNSRQKPAYHFGLGGMGKQEPVANQLGEFLTRSSTGRVIVTGNLNRYTIQNSYTVNKIVISPTLIDDQKGSVVSMINVTLSAVRPSPQEVQEVSNPVRLGNLVYTFNHQNPSNKVQPQRGLESSVSENNLDKHWSQQSQQQQPEPKLEDGLEIPFLANSVGYMGQAIKHSANVDIKDMIQKVAREIGQNLKSLDTLLKNHVLCRFEILIKYIRTLNIQELEQVSEKLYTTDKEGVNYNTWRVFQSALGQSGSGPSLILLENYIKTNKLLADEAAEITTTITRNVRQPTLKFIRKLFDLYKSSELQSKSQLRQQILFSLAKLVHKVYVHKRESHNEYPVHVWGEFRTEEGIQFMRQTIIPYLEEQLKQAVDKDDSHNIHQHITALGIIGDTSILKVFEPYLEGRQQISQFQRLSIVVSLERLAQESPEVTRNVLYKIYQNIGEEQEIRVAAVFQLMRTNPSTELLQRMAQYTNMEEHENVNAAVISSIESASKLESPQYEELRRAALGAKPLLIKKTYGIRQSQNYLSEYILDQLRVIYNQAIQTISSAGSELPNVFKYTLDKLSGRWQESLVNANLMVSNVDELINGLEKETLSYREARSKSENVANEKYSSSTIGRLLNVKVNEREPLEGLLNVQMGNVEQFITVNNHTLKNLPEVIRQLEQMLKQGKRIDELKFLDMDEFELAFPTEMGLPFVYTYTKPTLLKVNGNLKVQSQPAISSGGQLQVPERIYLQGKVVASVYGHVQGHISFNTPFDHQQYIAGYEKKVLTQLPVDVTTEMNLKEMQFETEFKLPNENQADLHMFHYSTWPYTSSADILSPEPIVLRKSTHLIKQLTQHKGDQVIGGKTTGVAIRVQYQYEQQGNKAWLLLNALQQNNLLGSFMQLTNNDIIEHSTFNVYYVPSQSTTQKIFVKFGIQQQYATKSVGDFNSKNLHDLREVAKTPEEAMARQHNFLGKVATGISSVHSKVVDAEIEFRGQSTVTYTLTGAYAKSNVDPKSRMLLRFKKSSQNKPFVFALIAKSEIPNTGGIQISDSWRIEPKVNAHLKAAIGSTEQDLNKVELEIKLRRSEARKRYLQNNQVYHNCESEMRQGNYYQQACAQSHIVSDLLDEINLKLLHENLPSDIKNNVEVLYNIVRFGTPLTSYSEIQQKPDENNELNIKINFAPDLKTVDVMVQSGRDETKFRSVPIDEWIKTLFVAHPVFHLKSRVYSKVLGYDEIRPICVVDQTVIDTFSKKVYPISALDKDWTVVMHYVPERARENQQVVLGTELLTRQNEQYVILTRRNEQNQKQKEVKITVIEPRSNGELIDITMSPASGSQSKAQVLVKGQPVEINDKQSYDIAKDLVQIYALPNGEVKVEVRDNFYVIYDGERFKVTLLSGKFRDQILGLCGQNNDQPTTDFLTPDNCIVKDAREFINSFSLQQQKQRQPPTHCVKPKTSYVNVITEQDIGQKVDNVEVNTKYTTRYIEESNEICFTTRPIPVCKNGRALVMESQEVPVHCVKKSSVSDMWKKQMDRGASPDFGHKPVTRTYPMNIPSRCA